jgi:hypothetical protein
VSERGEDEPDGFIGLPPGMAPLELDADSATHRVQRREREEIVFFAAPPGAPAPVAEASEVAEVIDATDEEGELPSRASGIATWRITPPGQQPISVDVPLYLGRNPTVPADAPTGRAVAIDDQGKSVSKTHALFEVEAGDLWVADLDSTNGVWIVSADGDATDVSPGRPMQVPPGSDVELGDVVVRVEQVTAG